MRCETALALESLAIDAQESTRLFPTFWILTQPDNAGNRHIRTRRSLGPKDALPNKSDKRRGSYMLDQMAARDRATRRAIETGLMPNIDLIHQSQKREGFQACFGRSKDVCHSTQCKWHGECSALASFRPTRALGIAAKRRPRSRTLGQPSFDEFRDGLHDSSRCDTHRNKAAHSTAAHHQAAHNGFDRNSDAAAAGAAAASVLDSLPSIQL